jgi:hypothetical protein
MRRIPHKADAADHLPDEAEFGMRVLRRGRMWVKQPEITGAKPPNLCKNKGIYRAEVRAES